MTSSLFFLLHTFGFLISHISKFHGYSKLSSYKNIILVFWKAPTYIWVKTNTDGSFVDSLASCGEIFRDHLGTFLGCFASNLGEVSVFEAEVTSLILALEFASSHNWVWLLLDSDSSSVVHTFHNPEVIPFRLINR
jgi:hypothetical protein